MKLLALVESPDHVCCRYRIRAFAPALSDAGWSLTCRRSRSRVTSPALPASPGDAIRRGDPAAQAFARLAVECPAPMLRGISSSTSTTPSDSAIRTIDAVTQSRWRSRRFAQTVCMADTVVAGNDFLADCALRAGARVERVHVIPTCVDPRLTRSRGTTPVAEPVDLVWIGSASTLQGLEQSRPIWERLAEGIPATEAARHLRPFPESFPLPVDSGRLERADRSARDRGRAHRGELASRRPLEPGKVRAEGPAVPGGRSAGRRQPGRVAS